MAASAALAALAAAVTLVLSPGPKVHVQTDRSIKTDTPGAGLTAWAPTAAEGPSPAEPAPAPEPAADAAAPEPVLVASSAPTRAEGPARAPAIDLGCHGSAPCQRLVALGSVAGGLGLAALAAGAALLIRPAAVDPGDPTTIVTYRPAGAALLAVGSGLAATWLLTLLAARKASRLAQRRRVSSTVP